MGAVSLGWLLLRLLLSLSSPPALGACELSLACNGRKEGKGVSEW